MKVSRLTVKIIVVLVAALLLNYPIIAIAEGWPQPVPLLFIYILWAALVVIYFIFSLKRFK